MKRKSSGWIKVIVVDEDPLSCMYFQNILDEAHGFSCEQTFANCDDALEGIAQVKPDLILLDVGTPEIPGLTSVRRFRSHGIDMPVIMIAGHEDDELLFQAMCAGASGYVLRDMSVDDFLTTIKEIHAGGATMSTRIAKRALNLFQLCDENLLSEGELIVLGFLSRGQAVRDIAGKLLTSRHAVKRYIYQVYNKLSEATLHRHVHVSRVNGHGHLGLWRAQARS